MFMKLKECSDSSELRPQFLINWISEMLTSIARVNSGECVISVWEKKKVEVSSVPLQEWGGWWVL